MTTWPISFPTWWTNWTPAFARAGSVGDHGPLRGGTAWRAALSSLDDGQGVALRLLRGGVVLKK